MIPDILASYGAKLGVYAALLGAVWLHGCHTGEKQREAATEAVRAEYTTFKAQVQAEGDAAQAVADAQARRDIANQEKTDANFKVSINNLRADNQRLRSARAGGSQLPARPADTGCAESSICFDRAELDAAVRRLDAGVSGLIEEGAEIKLRLDTAIIWAGGLK